MPDPIKRPNKPVPDVPKREKPTKIPDDPPDLPKREKPEVPAKPQPDTPPKELPTRLKWY